MASKLDQLDSGLWTEDTNGYIASAYRDLDAAEFGIGEYALAFHKGAMPFHKAYRFKTLEGLEMAMRKVQPDLRRWRLRG